jgi:hypothetical protein
MTLIKITKLRHSIKSVVRVGYLLIQVMLSLEIKQNTKMDSAMKSKELTQILIHGLKLILQQLLLENLKGQ